MGNKLTGPKNNEFWRKCLSLSHCLQLRRAWGVYLTCFNYWLTGSNSGCWTSFVTRSISFPLVVFLLMKPHLSFPSPIHACIHRQLIGSQTITHLIRENVFHLQKNIVYFTFMFCLFVAIVYNNSGGKDFFLVCEAANGALAIGNNSTEIAKSCLLTVWSVVDWKKKVLLLFILIESSTQNNKEDTNN